VRVKLAPDRLWIAACAAVAALAAANLAAWIGLSLAALVAAASIAGAGAAWFARARSVQGALAWDGRTWLCELAGREAMAGVATVAIDLDRWMLLAFVPEHGGKRWLAFSRSEQAGAWSPLRAALFGARPAPAP